MSRASHRLEIRCNPANPVLYLACCGLFDLAARMDPEARGHWRTAASPAFLLESSIVSDVTLLTTVLDTLTDVNHWALETPKRGQEPTVVRARFTPPSSVGKEFSVALDWWYETVKVDGTISNSAWKMFAGQQTVPKILLRQKKDKLGMVCEAARLKATGKLPATFSELLSCAIMMSGRFGFDPLSSRNALDVGYSPNDIGQSVATAIFLEILVMFGINSFFPARTGRAGIVSSTRGWSWTEENSQDHGFAYVPWTRALPVMLARLAAQPTHNQPALFARRDDSRGDYKNLTLAHIIQIPR